MQRGNPLPSGAKLVTVAASHQFVSENGATLVRRHTLYMYLCFRMNHERISVDLVSFLVCMYLVSGFECFAQKIRGSHSIYREHYRISLWGRGFDVVNDDESIMTLLFVICIYIICIYVRVRSF
jgi:hypothetical protein